MNIERKVVLVCGGRDFGDLVTLVNRLVDRTDPVWIAREAEYNFILRKLDEILHPLESITDDMDTWLPGPGLRIVSGAARGADSVAIDWAVVNWVSIEEYPADWRANGLAAGPIRNQKMLDQEHPDLVIAFPGGKGTADMVRRARKANIPVMEISYELPKL